VHLVSFTVGIYYDARTYEHKKVRILGNPNEIRCGYFQNMSRTLGEFIYQNGDQTHITELCLTDATTFVAADVNNQAAICVSFVSVSGYTVSYSSIYK
jgi:hypothetical protein